MRGKTNRLRWQDAWSLGFAALSILLYFVILRLLDVSQPIAISVAIGVSYVGLMIQMRLDKADIVDRLDGLESEARVRLVGNNEQANLEITPKCAQARSVRNTFIGLVANHYDREVGRKSNHAQYYSWLRNPHDGHWVDVVGPIEKDDGRFTQIFVERPMGQHTVYILDHEIPIVNFIIFEYPNGNREVYFGWMASIKPEDSSLELIHCSSDPKVVDLFEFQFRQLTRAASASKVIAHDIKRDQRE